MCLKFNLRTLLYFFLLIVPLKWNFNLNLKIMYDESNCYWFFVPDGKFMQYWSDNVIYYEWAEHVEVEGKGDGWLFWVHR